MRLILFFDLPTTSKVDLRFYRHFVRDIQKIGFYRLQESVFVKLSIDPQAMMSVVNKIRPIVPPKGDIRILCMTEKQFSSMFLILGENKGDVITTLDKVVEI